MLNLFVHTTDYENVIKFCLIGLIAYFVEDGYVGNLMIFILVLSMFNIYINDFLYNNVDKTDYNTYLGTNISSVIIVNVIISLLINYKHEQIFKFGLEKLISTVMGALLYETFIFKTINYKVIENKQLRYIFKTALRIITINTTSQIIMNQPIDIITTLISVITYIALHSI